MTGRLSGKRALVTGAASGIGRAIADQFGVEGATVAALDRDEGALSTVLESLHDAGADALAIRADVRSETEVREAIGDAIRALGGLDILVANAGVQLFGADAPVHELTLASWQETIDTNLTGTFLTCKYGIRSMMEQGAGSVICLGSPTGLRGTATGFHAYSASKAGVFGLARVMAADYARNGIRVNVLVPGFTDTRLVASVMNTREAYSRVVGRHYPS